MKKFTKYPVNASQDPKKAVKASDDWDDDELEDWEEASDLITNALDELGLFDEPAGQGSTAVDIFYDEDYNELGRVKSTRIEDFAEGLLESDPDTALEKMKQYIKKICKI